MFTDPPDNVKIDGHVCGKGAVHHREFAMATGEMDRDAFMNFLEVSLGAMAGVSRDGAIHFVCMDCAEQARIRRVSREVPWASSAQD